MNQVLKSYGFDVQSFDSEMMKNRNITFLDTYFQKYQTMAANARDQGQCVFLFIYVRCHAFIPVVDDESNPVGKNLTEITDGKGFRFPLERNLRELSKLESFLGFAYIDTPRPILHLKPSHPKMIIQQDLKQLGHLFIKTTCKPGQGLEEFLKSDPQKGILGLANHLRDHSLVDFLAFAKSLPQTELIGDA